MKVMRDHDKGPEGVVTHWVGTFASMNEGVCAHFNWEGLSDECSGICPLTVCPRPLKALQLLPWPTLLTLYWTFSSLQSSLSFLPISPLFFFSPLLPTPLPALLRSHYLRAFTPPSC